MEQSDWEVVDSPSLEVFKRYVDVTIGTYSGGLGNVGLLVGLNGLKGLFQPKWFCD